MTWTKEARAEYMKKYRAEHREILNANRRYYYARNKEKFLEYQKAYQKENKDKLNAYHRNYYKANRDKIRSYQSAYYKLRKYVMGRSCEPICQNT